MNDDIEHNLYMHLIINMILVRPSQDLFSVSRCVGV